MRITSHWFPPALALLQTLLFLGLIASDYVREHGRKGFDAPDYIRKDLARPFFEPEDLCPDLVGFSAASEIGMALNPPAYLISGAVQSIVNWGRCPPDLRPRGQILTAAFVAPCWLLVGRNVRRFARRRWRRQAEGELVRSFLAFGLVLLFLLGLVQLLLSALAFFHTEWIGIRLLGLAVWPFYITMLVAEPLRFWPFTRIDRSAPGRLDQPGGRVGAILAVHQNRSERPWLCTIEHLSGPSAVGAIYAP